MTVEYVGQMRPKPLTSLEDMKANPQRALTVEHFASAYIGQRVPKGYTRETTEWALTKSGKKLFKAQEEAYLANPSARE